MTVTDTEGRDAATFLRETFEFETCAECGGDVEDHDALPLGLGDYGGPYFFAQCKHPPQENETMTDFTQDIPEDLARRAHAGTSFVPEQRAQQEREGYAATLAADHAALAKLADTDDKRATLATEFERYRQGYRRRFLAYLGAKGACLSTMIAGPSKFPSRRMQKRGATADRRGGELAEFRARALAAIRKALRPEDRPIMSGDSDAAQRLREKIAQAEASQARMRAANAAIRKHAKAGPDAQVAALVALGLSESVARERLKPDFAGRVGFADFETKNNGANIRRMKERLAQVERDQAAPVAEVEGASARLEDCPADNRVRLFFPGKPAADVRARLKGSGFRWTPSLGCWQAYRNHNALATARREAGLTRKIRIKCEDDSPAFDQTVRTVIVARETETSWFGTPEDNPACPEIEWPKFAWKEVP